MGAFVIIAAAAVILALTADLGSKTSIRYRNADQEAGKHGHIEKQK